MDTQKVRGGGVDILIVSSAVLGYAGKIYAEKKHKSEEIRLKEYNTPEKLPNTLENTPENLQI